MLHAAAYNGNRFTYQPSTYPPMVQEARDIGPNARILITDAPRLNSEDNAPSRLQMLAGGVTTPCISTYASAYQMACILLTEQCNSLATTG
jgi:hypothetical protein